MLYKKLITATEGYAGEAPIIHQAVAVKAAIEKTDLASKKEMEALNKKVQALSARVKKLEEEKESGQ